MNYKTKQTGYGYRRKSYSRSRKKSPPAPWGKLFFFLFVAGLFVFFVFKLFAVIFDNVRSEPVKAELQVLRGKAEFYFARQKEEWQSANSGLQFMAGDYLRTTGNSRASLSFFTGNTLFLNENTEIFLETLEERSSGKKTVNIHLKKGEIWVKTSGEEFSPDLGSSFKITTDLSQVHVTGTIFDIDSQEDQDTIRLIQGNVEVDIFQEDPELDPWRVAVEVGQKLIVSPTNKLKLLNGDTDIKEIMDSGFLESEWHIQNIEQFSPQEAAELKRRVEMKNQVEVPSVPSEPEEAPALDVIVERGRPEILSPKNAEVIPGEVDLLAIEGSAPHDTFQIVVNGYTLTKFNPGDRKWQYFASTKFGTIVPGENTYEVVAVFRDGKRSEPVSITITYDKKEDPTPPSDPVLTDTAQEVPPSSLEGQAFKSPVITKPTAILPGEVYETSAEAFTITGLVDPQTTKVVVNGYQLGRFNPGDTEFRYTVNSRVQNANLVPGENVYTITAFTEDGREASTTIKIVYTPINVR